MSQWTPGQLEELARAHQIRVAGRRADGSSRTLTIVWQVVVDGALYVRSVKGPDGEWFKGVARHHEGFIEWDGRVHAVGYTRDDSHEAQIDAAYYAKYGNGSATRSITSDTAKETTLRVEPQGAPHVQSD